MDKIRAVDFCCGAGGWAVAARGLPIEFVAVADRAADCMETWRINHQADHPKAMRFLGDLSIRDNVDLILHHSTPVDLVLGGIPCEQVSTARGQGGNGVAQGDELAQWHSLIDHTIRFVRDSGARWWAIEDVIQVEKHLPLPLELGNIPSVRINAAHFGPQRRHRTFLGKFPRPKPIYRDGECTIADLIEEGPHRTVPNEESFTRQGIRGRNTGRVDNDKVRVLPLDDAAPTILGSLDNGSRQRRAFTIAQPDGRVRLMTWREAARIQGFPRDFLFAGSELRTHKMVGQAIPIYVGRAILEGVVRQWESQRTKQLSAATEA
jgi:site-specific DNA-cytosine methylase